MSTYWHVACRTCDETHHFNDANHQDVFMSRVAKLAPPPGDPRTARW